MTRRIVVPGLDLEEETVVLPPDAARHLVTVLRLKRDDEVLLLDGAGLQARARVRSVSHRAVELVLTERCSAAIHATPELHLIQALPKGAKLDEIIRKTTELGVTSIRPALSARSVTRPEADRSRRRVERWQRIAREAARLCGRGLVPSIAPLEPWEKALDAAPTETKRLVLWEDEAGVGLVDVLGGKRENQGVTLAIGPEGGFGPDEVEAASNRGFEPASLGPLVLRVETAAIAACVLAQHCLGALRPPG